MLFFNIIVIESFYYTYLMSNQVNFENSIWWWSLEFREVEFEETFREERRTLKQVPQQIRYFFLVATLTVVLLIILDFLSAVAFETRYAYGTYDVLSLCVYGPIMVAEYFCYNCSKVAVIRGSVFTIVIYFFLFSSTLASSADTLDYPAISPTYRFSLGVTFFMNSGIGFCFGME